MRRSLATVVAVVVMLGALTVGASTASTRTAANGVTQDEIKIGILIDKMRCFATIGGFQHEDVGRQLLQDVP